MQCLYRRVKVLSGISLVKAMLLCCQSVFDFYLGGNIKSIDFSSGKEMLFYPVW